jgi:hypothetical protein
VSSRFKVQQIVVEFLPTLVMDNSSPRPGDCKRSPRSGAQRIMKNCIAIILPFVITAPLFVHADDGISVDKAIDVLESSLNKRERINAVAALRNAREAATPAARVLARIIAQDACGDEAGYAAESLGYIGKPSIPLIASLIQNGFDWSYLCASRAYCLPHGLDELILSELEPTLTGNVTHEERFNAILMLRYYPLKPESANNVCRMLMSKQYIASGPAVAFFIAPKANDSRILDSIDALSLKSTKYLGARIREDWRRRPILHRLSMPRKPQPLSKEEQARFAEADAGLTVLAKEAMPEALDKLRHAYGTHEQYFWLEMLRYLAEHSSPSRNETKQVLDHVNRARGSTIDRLLVEYSDELNKNGEQSPAGDALKAAPEE